LIPQSYDFEDHTHGVIYASTVLDRQAIELMNRLRPDLVTRTCIEDIVFLAEHNPEIWEELRPIVDALHVRAVRRMLLLEVDVLAVATMQRQRREAFEQDLKVPDGGGTPGWRQSQVKIILASLVEDEALEPEERDSWTQLAGQVGP
jgi:hypothetical protein